MAKPLLPFVPCFSPGVGGKERRVFLMEKIICTVTEVITKFNQVEGPAVSTEVCEAWTRSLRELGTLEFGVFACPPINARLLYGDNPEDYILTSSVGTSFEKGGIDKRIAKMLRSLREAGVESSLRVIIGDTDEDDYVFPMLAGPGKLDPQKTETQKAVFYKNFADYLAGNFPWPTQVDRYSEIAALFDDSLPEIDLDDLIKEDMREEVKQFGGNFEVGGYYEGLEPPLLQQLQEMTRLKFVAYGRQGRRLVQMYPNMVLIQNELPLYMRTRMLNNLNDQLGTPPLPVIYPIQDRSRRNG